MVNTFSLETRFYIVCIACTTTLRRIMLTCCAGRLFGIIRVYKNGNLYVVDRRFARSRVRRVFITIVYNWSNIPANEPMSTGGDSHKRARSNVHNQLTIEWFYIHVSAYNAKYILSCLLSYHAQRSYIL